jgi:hypothetical protein
MASEFFLDSRRAGNEKAAVLAGCGKRQGQSDLGGTGFCH